MPRLLRIGLPVALAALAVPASATAHGVGQRADLPMMQAIVLVLSVFYIVLTFLADMLNAWLDPRIRVA